MNIKQTLSQPTETDNFFTPVANTKPYFKAAFEGFAGSGKTYTAAQIALGLYKRVGSKKPIVIFDTEKAAKFLKSMFAVEGIELLVRESRSLAETLSKEMGPLQSKNISDQSRMIFPAAFFTHVYKMLSKNYHVLYNDFYAAPLT